MMYYGFWRTLGNFIVRAIIVAYFLLIANIAALIHIFSGHFSNTDWEFYGLVFGIDAFIALICWGVSYDNKKEG